MKLAIMQPYPFPYIGYFELMAQVDRWVVLDVVQYSRHTWMNRNRILRPDEGWQYFVLPVKKMPLGTSMQQILLANPDEMQRKLQAQLQHYRKCAPYFPLVMDMVRDVFSRLKTNRLVEFNVASLNVVAERLAIPTALELCSSLGELKNVEHPGQIALQISKWLGADIYINPPGGREIFDPQEWKASDIRLAFTKMNDLRYECGSYAFEPNLSILDVLMWNSVGEVQAWLRSRLTGSVVYAI
ncbi:WbqC family protein [Pseudothauera rhizosphaerae]|uniref:WbqC-like protein family protein n=1 Tax=Pseudothauera rhizosphaerae TaxID=2565932 RepID=A0A4S4AZT7_9RHOO|nr:WbqC family protein [Pseudothauera rhizosphaerae]THF64145.1 hypothetical protein E6O51_02130 [Pseudothauera rhizosphaerae]